MSEGAGKGDRYRPVNRDKWDEGWERIFGKTEQPDDGCSVSIGATGDKEIQVQQ